ncbi:hypothetical protein [Streptomyces sp. NPDC056549]|uniref:hypothetical protein n=1 Tax=Streptomyces sp. NPDC056549 TaxID=3345864 RepID=UPI0036A83DE0
MPHPPTDIPLTDTPPPEPGRPGASDTPRAPEPDRASPAPLSPGPGATAPGAESAWSARFVRLGAPRPGPAARRARWFGVPLVPLLTAALVAGAFLTARGGAEGGGLADGRTGGDPAGVPSPVVTSGTGPAAPTPADGTEPATSTPTDARGTADTPSAGTPTHSSTTGATPTRTAPEGRAGRPQDSSSPTRHRSGNTDPAGGTPSTGTTPSGRPKGDRRTVPPVSFEALRVGECFDIDRDAPGTALRRRCDTPHHAELIARLRLVGTFATDQAVREAATLLCREPLRRKAARQPLGTRWTTFVQYPYRTSHLLGADTVACSLATTTGTLSHRLQ